MEYIYYKTIDSTNNEAKRLINTGQITQDTCLVSDEQTAGRGRQGKSFFSPDTGLYMTAVFPVDRSISSQVTVTTRTACAVADALEECTGKEIGIKWVNDIYVDGKKCCGILCEAVNDYDLGKLKYIIIGIGVNIYTKEWPEELKNIAGSLFGDDSVTCGEAVVKPSGTEYSDFKERLLKTIADKLYEWVYDASDSDFIEYYKRHSIVLGKKILFIENGATMEGIARDIDENGGLVVEISRDGECSDSSRLYRTLSSGEISLKVRET